MKKLLFVTAGLLFMAFAPTMASANHEPSCIQIAKAKEYVAVWDKAAVWEYVKEGYKFDALMAWAKARVAVPAAVDGILVVYVTNPNTGAKMVIWTISPDGQCAETSTYQEMTRNEFDNIVDKGI